MRLGLAGACIRMEKSSCAKGTHMELSPINGVSVWQPEVRLADPHVSSDDRNSLSIIFSMYEALVRPDEAGGYLPVLAQSWSVSEDARCWTFGLRPDVSFHDGSLLHADDVVANLRRVCEPNIYGELGTQGVYRSYLKGAEFEAIDALTVRLVTRRPFADLLDLICRFPIVPQDAISGLPSKPIGSGPYQLGDAGPSRVLMEAFSDYWHGVAPVGRILWRSEPSLSRRVDALLTGQADLVTGVTPEEAARVREADECTLFFAPSSVCTVFLCNLMSGVCRDKRVRQALNYALDVPRLIEGVMGGWARPISGPITPAHFGHDPEVSPFSYDPDKARDLLAAAGIGEDSRMVLDVPTRLPDEAPLLGERLAEYYGDVGILVEIKAFEDRLDYADKVRAKEIDDACCFDSSPLSTYRTLREKLHSGVRGPWWQGYDRQEVNALIDQSQSTVQGHEREAIFQRVHRLIRQDAPWIFLYNPFNVWGVSHALEGWSASMDGLIRFT